MNCNRSTAHEVFIYHADRRTLGYLHPPYSDFVRRGARPRCDPHWHGLGDSSGRENQERQVYLLQNLYDLSDEATVAEAIDSRAFSDFCGVDSSNQVPDGDTLGSGFALCRALMQIGKKARVINDDEIPKKYNYLFDDIEFEDFEPSYIVAVDVATENLLGSLQDKYAGSDTTKASKKMFDMAGVKYRQFVPKGQTIEVDL